MCLCSLVLFICYLIMAADTNVMLVFLFVPILDSLFLAELADE